MRLFVFAALSMAAAAGATALEGLDKIADKVWSAEKAVADGAEWVSFSTVDGKLVRSSAASSVRETPEGLIEIAREEPDAVSRQLFEKSGRLRLLSAESRSKGYSLSVSIDEKRSKADFSVRADGKAQAKTQKLGPRHLHSSEVVNAAKGAWRIGVRDGFAFKSFSPDGAMEADMEIRFRKSDEPAALSDKYRFPDDFRAALKGRDFVVAEMKLTGIGAMFYPHVMRFVFVEKDGGLDMVGYFGGDPKTDASFQYRVGLGG